MQCSKCQHVNRDGARFCEECGEITPDGTIQVGVHAIGMIDRTIYCGEYKEGTATLFRNFRLWTK